MKKEMLCISWDCAWRRSSTKLDRQYRQELLRLVRLKADIDEKRPELANYNDVTLTQDNDRPHLSFQTQENLVYFCWDDLIHPRYSSYLERFAPYKILLLGEKSVLWEKPRSSPRQLPRFRRMQLPSCHKRWRKVME